MSRNFELLMINEEARTLNKTPGNSERDFQCYAQNVCCNGKTKKVDICF